MKLLVRTLLLRTVGEEEEVLSRVRKGDEKIRCGEAIFRAELQIRVAVRSVKGHKEN